ncbi:hypothetical protein D1BOALGB6SA_3681 [Olavius sp. associated proteobacterium Delta 1]|nr:hypothetical protein D1BOALGB6SA_3681 [Olavius sp. associated proteobacterium Delta 1]
MSTREKIQREIRRRALDRAELHHQEAADRQYTRYTIDALAEVTGLPRLELETIANEVRASSYGTGQDGFFSIKNQIIRVGSALVPLIIVAWLIVAIV